MSDIDEHYAERIDELEAEVERWKALAATMEQQVADLGVTRLRLDAANALLERVRTQQRPSVKLLWDITDHLGAQRVGPIRCQTHDALLVNLAFFACGCRHICAPPEETP